MNTIHIQAPEKSEQVEHEFELDGWVNVYLTDTGNTVRGWGTWRTAEEAMEMLRLIGMYPGWVYLATMPLCEWKA